MTTKKSRGYLVSFRGLLGLGMLFLAAPFAQASGFGDECFDMECDSFFAPEVIDSPSESPFFRSRHVFYSYSADGQDRLAEVNRVNDKGWSAYFDGAVPADQLTQLIYKLPEAETKNLQRALDGQNVALSPEATQLKETFLRYNQKAKVSEALNYLRFAKRVEPLATRRLGWEEWDTPEPVDGAADARATQALLDESVALIRNSSDRNLANRYRFQALRLYFYGGRFREAQDYYLQNISKFTSENSVKYRFMETGAGAFYKDKKYGRANYIYSLIYGKFSPLKRSAFFSFHPQENEDWNATLAMARNNTERETIWQLFGVYADGQTAIEKIYAINPQSKLLPLLLVREVNMAEEAWSANQENINHPIDGIVNEIKTDLETVTQKRLDLVARIANGGAAYKPFLWHLALAHLYALAGDPLMANAALGRAEQGSSLSDDVKAQIRQTRLFAKVRGMSETSVDAEESLAPELTWLSEYQKDETKFRASTLNTWVLKELSRFYAQKNDVIRALLLTDSPRDAFYRSNGQIDAMIAFLKRREKSGFDTFLTKNSNYSTEQLEELKSINSMYAGRIDEAVESFARVGAEVRTENLRADPFVIHNIDCHDCDFEAPHTSYTKVSFALRMKELAARAEGQGQDAAEASFELANGYYNMSYFGNARDFYDTQHENLRPAWDWKHATKDPVLSMDLAEKYYSQAMAKSSNREFQAKACFMAAKAEQNRAVNVNREAIDNGLPGDGVNIRPGVYYAKLRDQFSDTQYFQEIINECGYFQTYMTVHPLTK